MQFVIHEKVPATPTKGWRNCSSIGLEVMSAPSGCHYHRQGEGLLSGVLRRVLRVPGGSVWHCPTVSESLSVFLLHFSLHFLHQIISIYQSWNSLQIFFWNHLVSFSCQLLEFPCFFFLFYNLYFYGVTLFKEFVNFYVSY